MATKISKNKVSKLLDWAYLKSIHGMVNFDSAVVLSEKYLHQPNLSLQKKVNKLIHSQNMKAGATGFLSGIAGVIILPVSVPAIFTITLLIQVRMIAAIAYMGGYDLKDDKIRTAVYLCLAGNISKDILVDTGIQYGTGLMVRNIANLSPGVLMILQKKIGFLLFRRISTRNMSQIIRMIPIAGGIVAGGIDITANNIVGNYARITFISSQRSLPEF